MSIGWVGCRQLHAVRSITGSYVHFSPHLPKSQETKKFALIMFFFVVITISRHSRGQNRAG